MAQGGSEISGASIRMVSPPQSSQPETAAMAAGALLPETTRFQQGQQDDGHISENDIPLPSRQSITVTRTLDIAPESSPPSGPTKSASMEGLASRGSYGYVQGGASSDSQTLRAVTSLGALLPSIPKMSAIDLTRPFVPSSAANMLPQSRPSTAPEQQEDVSAPAAAPLAPRLPPFRQSRRWARMCEAPARPKSSAGHHQHGHERVVSEEDRPMTLREASFEQQRAIWKHAAAPVVVVDAPEVIEETTTTTANNAPAAEQPLPSPTPPNPQQQQQQQQDRSKRHYRTSPVRPDDVSSILATQGLCRPLSLPTWQMVRATRSNRTSSSQSAGSGSVFFRRLGMHRTRTGTTRHHRRQQSVEKNTTMPATRNSKSSQIGRKRAVSDLRRRANPAAIVVAPAARHQQQHRAVAARSQVIDLDAYTPPRGSEQKRPSSPVPSLHDPEKAKRFSEECEEMLSNTNFEKDFISPPVSRSPTDSSKKPTATAIAPSQATAIEAAGEKSSPPAAKDKDKAPAPQASVRVEPPSAMLTAPEPPERSSSKNAARLATVVSMTKPICIPVLSGFKDGGLIAPDDVSEQIPAQHSLVVPQRLRAPFRMASNASTVRSGDESVKRPRGAAISTDTLAFIEAQVPDQTPPSTSLVERLKQKTGFGISSSAKKLGPSGAPPERPLPDLPAEDALSVASTRAGPARLPSTSSKRGSKQSALSQGLPERQSSDPGTEQRHAPTVAAAKGLSVKPTTTTTTNNDTESLGDSILPTPSSVYSQASFLSELSSIKPPRFIRHDKTKFRADRVSQVKRRVRADMSRRDRPRISEEGEENDNDNDTDGGENTRREVITKVYKDLDPPLPPPHPQHLREQPSLDQLDQFPPVPASRPASRASHNSGSKRGQSRTRSHARQSSKASSRYSYRPAMPARVPTNGSATSGASRQVLCASQIRVLVDTNPVTGRFRAGAISPDHASSSSSSHEGSPAKSLPAGLRSLRSLHLPLPSRIDENGDSYDHHSATSGSPVRQRSTKSPRKEASLRSLHSHTGSTGRRSANASSSRQSHHRGGKAVHRRMSFDTYASLNSSPSSSESESEAELPLLPLSTATTASNLNIASPNDAKLASSAKKKKLRRRWNSNDIRAVQILSDTVFAHEREIQAMREEHEREIQRQREEIRKLMRVMAPMNRARGLRTDQLVVDDASSTRSRETTILAPSPSLIPPPLTTSVSNSAMATAASRTTVSATGSPSRTTVRSSSPSKMGPYGHTHSHAYSSSKARLDAEEAALVAVLRERGVSPGKDHQQQKDSAKSTTGAPPDTLFRERPISNISSLSGSTYSSHGSGVSTASSAKLAGPSSRRRDGLDLSSGGEAEPRKSKEEGSMTDPREYELDLSPTVESKHEDAAIAHKAVVGFGQGNIKTSSVSRPTTSTAAATAPASPRPKSRGTLSLRSFRSKTSKQAKEKTMASPVVGLHRPPPIPARIKREVLSEEEDGFLSAVSRNGSSSDLLAAAGVVRKEGYLRLPGLGSSVEDLAEDGNEQRDLGGELGLGEVRRGLGLKAEENIVLGDGLSAVNSLLTVGGDDMDAGNRLSVNHAFARTEAFDRMLEGF